MHVLALLVWCGALGTTVFCAGVLLQLWRERRELCSWPYTEHEPPARIYLGMDRQHTGRVSVTWWLWRMSGSDVEYIRKDLSDQRLAAARAAHIPSPDLKGN